MEMEERHRFDRKLVCVKYPGLVNDEKKMLETLGGTQNISNVLSVKNQRLGLHFRPDDPSSKATYGDREKVAGLLLKVRVPRKPRCSTDESCSTSSEQIYSYSVVGRVTETFNFKSLFDFQYLPQESGPEGEDQKCILDKVFPTTGLPPMSWLSEDNEHLFLLPPALSRMDTPSLYCYRTEATEMAQLDPTAPPTEKAQRISRKYYTQRITFAEKTIIPTEPLPAAVKEYKQRKIPAALLESLENLFDRRPVWSRAALQVECQSISENAMRYLLPIVAYYFMSGPWRLLWVRYGYNPQENPEARIYQLLEYRVQAPRLRSLVKVRIRARSIHLPQKQQKHYSRRNFISSDILKGVKPTAVEKKKAVLDDSYYKFRRGMIPAHSNMLYQFLDVELAEVKEEMSKPVSHKAVCLERFGWFTSEFYDRTRKLIDEVALASAAAIYGQDTSENSKDEEYTESGNSSDSSDSSLVILSSEEEESEPEPEYDVEDDSD